LQVIYVIVENTIKEEPSIRVQQDGIPVCLFHVSSVETTDKNQVEEKMIKNVQPVGCCSLPQEVQ